MPMFHVLAAYQCAVSFKKTLKSEKRKLTKKQMKKIFSLNCIYVTILLFCSFVHRKKEES